ncbi:MAG: tol-pal system protein YbgF [Methylococcaceae bacterium]
MKKLPALLLFASSFALADSLAPVIDNSSYPTGGVPQQTPTPVSSSMNSTFELMTRLDEAQAEIQQLNGKIEEQTYLISELKKKQSAMFADFDDRLQQIENKASGAKSAETSESATTKTVEPVSETVPPPKPTPTTSTAVSSVPAAGSQTPYQEAFAAFRNGQVTEAINQFNALLSKDPNNQLANNAQFWLGEAYRVNKDIPSAKKAFSAVLEKYPNSQKIPDALLKLGSIEMDAKNSAKAKELFTRVITDYPTSKPAEVAAKKLQQLNGTP